MGGWVSVVGVVNFGSSPTYLLSLPFSFPPTRIGGRECVHQIGWIGEHSLLNSHTPVTNWRQLCQKNEWEGWVEKVAAKGVYINPSKSLSVLPSWLQVSDHDFFKMKIPNVNGLALGLGRGPSSWKDAYEWKGLAKDLVFFSLRNQYAGFSS